MVKLILVVASLGAGLCGLLLTHTLWPYKSSQDRSVSVARLDAQKSAIPQQTTSLPAAKDPQPENSMVEPQVPPRLGPTTDTTERFLLVCVQYGRHNNQLIALAKSYSLAYHSNRTLVLPWLYKKHPNDEGTHPTEALYDLSKGPVHIITTQQFFSTWGDYKWNQDEVMCMDWVQRCSYTKGTIPCTKLSRPTDDAHHNVRRSVTAARLMITGGENTFFANVPHTPCMYKWLQLQAKYQKEVDRAKQLLQLPDKYFGLHLRWMENKCRWALGKAHTKAYEKHGLPKPDFVKEIFPMCQMQREYYRRFWNGTEKFFVAHDHQFDSATYRALVQDGAVFYSSSKAPGIFQAEEGMIIDFWLLVGADVFVGNAMSTLSMNVCAVRSALGKSCDNMKLLAELYPCFPHPDFDKALKAVK